MPSQGYELMGETIDKSVAETHVLRLFRGYVAVPNSLERLRGAFVRGKFLASDTLPEQFKFLGDGVFSRDENKNLVVTIKIRMNAADMVGDRKSVEIQPTQQLKLTFDESKRSVHRAGDHVGYVKEFSPQPRMTQTPRIYANIQLRRKNLHITDYRTTSMRGSRRKISYPTGGAGGAGAAAAPV